MSAADPQPPDENEMKFVYGYGARKHIRDTVTTHRGEWGLCGAPGGHPLMRDSLPVCKRCVAIEKRGRPYPSEPISAKTSNESWCCE